MEIRNDFELPLPPDRAWDVLLDIPRIAPCMPGAEFLEQTPDGTYKGKVSVKLGPVALSFTGTADFVEKDFPAKRAVAKARGSDQKGRGGANATITFNLSPSPGGTRVDVLTDVALTGLVAQYGRGAGVIQGVATQLVGQFATNLRNTLSQMEIQAASLPSAGTGDVEDGPTALAPSPAHIPAKPISGFSLIFGALWQGIVGLFKRKA